MTPDEFAALVDATGLSPQQLADAAEIRNDKMIRNWSSGAIPIPLWFAHWLGELAAALAPTTVEFRQLKSRLRAINEWRADIIRDHPPPPNPAGTVARVIEDRRQRP